MLKSEAEKNQDVTCKRFKFSFNLSIYFPNAASNSISHNLPTAVYVIQLIKKFLILEKEVSVLLLEKSACNRIVQTSMQHDTSSISYKYYPPTYDLDVKW